MTAKDLKNALLQEAVQGKLVPQIASEGNARDLLEEIRKEKLSHGLDFANAKSGKKKSKKETALAGSNPCDIKEDEIPFDIPENWCWCRLGDCVNVQSSKRVFEKDYVNSGIPFYRSKEIGELSKGNQINTELFITKEHYKKLKETVGLPQKGDILLCSIGGSIGNTWINDGRDFYYKDGNVTQICNNKFIDTIFINYYLHSDLFTKQVKSEVAGSAYNALTIIKIKNLLFPLPPLAEQKRIVAAIEKFMPLIEEYGKKETELKAFNEQIGALTKKAILQEAVQGKLVPQIASEGNAKDLMEEIRKERLSHGFANSYGICGEKDKKSKSSDLRSKSQIRVTKKELPEITEDEIPFDIPESWCWCRLGEIVINRDRERIPLSVAEREKLAKTYDYYGASGVIDRVDKYLFDKPLLLIGEDGANLLNRSTPIAFIAKGKYWVNNHAHVLDCDDRYIFMEYVMTYINSISLAKYVTGTAQPKMNQEKMNSIPVPLPPLAEQKRIVAAIEKMLPLCEKLGE